jgi:hypothetical protein
MDKEISKQELELNGFNLLFTPTLFTFLAIKKHRYGEITGVT